MEGDLQTASASLSSFSPSSSSSTAMVVHEQPSLPPGTIKKTMTKQDVVTNLIAFDKSQSDG